MILTQEMQTGTTSAILDEPQATAQRVFSLVVPELVLVEAEFERQARSNIQVVAYLGDYLRASGGKRVRPALNILSTYATGGDGARHNAIRMATVMEFLHTATLVHDDIIDNADIRRNRPSVNSRFGNQTAVLMGDWLYMSAFETSLAERSLDILDILTSVTRKMTEGELIQLTLLGRTDLTSEQYFDVLERKTAYLFSACCEIGALLGEPRDEWRVALRDYGMKLGTAFQLADDLLDFTATESMLGKPAGADLLEGKLTLPLILLVEQEPSWRTAIQSVINSGNYDTVSREALLEAAKTSGVLKRAREIARSYAESARDAIDLLPPSKYADALRAIPSYIIDRER
jgi:octaprenyl-diphosphate synthase